MNPDDLRKLLRAVASGKTTIPLAVERLRDLPFENLGDVRVDHHRHLRKGFPEVIYGEGKTAEQCATIVSLLAKAGQPALVTRANRKQFDEIARLNPGAVWHERARLITLTPSASSGAGGPGTGRQGRPAALGRTRRGKAGSRREEILVVTAGTSDIPIAEEAALTAEIMGFSVGRLFDVGVAGIHRIAAERRRLEAARVIIVAAGMEGALPSVVAGMVSVPVIGLPTSVGYGAALGGLTALFGMLTSCAGGLTVVNIDNGFGAGYAAAQIARQRARQNPL